MRSPNYDLQPSIAVPGECFRGWEAVCAQLSSHRRIAFETYSGLHEPQIIEQLRRWLPDHNFISTSQAMKSEAEIEEMLAPFLGNDPVFGRLCPLELEEFFTSSDVARMREEFLSVSGPVIVFGPGASWFLEYDALVYADMPRWEGQLRQRRGEVSNLGVQNAGLRASLQYKRSFFVDWRVLDRHKQSTMATWDFVLDTTHTEDPKLVEGSAYRSALVEATRRPFRLVPFFDPGPWGGQWMREVCGLDPAPANFAWCFDGVPEENSLLFRFGTETFETPAINLVFAHPSELLGNDVYGAFGAEFPIRFDLLDTMGGGNLSLQVHPTKQFARDQFGIAYTQDESYYLLDASPGAQVYLGLKEGIDEESMLSSLEIANTGGPEFPAEEFAASFPAQKHDHFPIPAGTVHCSGKNSMVLEISATPYIFTFKLWDWGRLGLDGRPRPVHLQHGSQVIDWSRTETWVADQLVNRIELVASGEGWREERTGLHELEFIETRRHWFEGPVPHDTEGNLNVLNLVEGDEAIVESPGGLFEPFVVHYAETFIVPAFVGPYTICPYGTSAGKTCATLKAFVRPRIVTDSIGIQGSLTQMGRVKDPETRVVGF